MSSSKQRTEGWELRLSGFIASKMSTPFAWGSHDCCAFASGSVLAMTGYDAMQMHSGYSDADGAARVIRDAGGIECIPELPGFTKLKSPMQARRGDIVSIDVDGRVSLGVCAGIESFFASSVGLSSRQTVKCRNAWRVE